MRAFPIKPIGIIHSPFQEVAGTPIQPAAARGIEGSVEVFPEFVGGLQDLEGFERIWLLYWFHRAGPARLVVTPFLDETPRGVFATRAPTRPNPIGLSAVELLRVEGSTLYIRDVDMLDGTPLLDIKPYAPRFDHFAVTRMGWLAEARGPEVADDRFATR
jgi:tRNA-Thr(GGU) m(6)t(6)A37 methyltransferase TsaA